MHAIRRLRTLPLRAGAVVALLATLAAGCDRLPGRGDGRTGSAPVQPTTTGAARPSGAAGLTLEPAAGLGHLAASDVAAGPGGFLAVGAAGMALSADGRAWEPVPDAPRGMRSVVAGGPGWVAAGGTDIWTSPDGIRWTRSTVDAVGGRRPTFALVVPSPDGLLAVGDGGGDAGPVVHRSRDGSRWVVAGAGPGARRAGLVVAAGAFVGDRFVVALETGRVRGTPEVQGAWVSTSADGVEWTPPVALPGTRPSVGGIAALGSRIVVVGSVGDAAGVDAAAWRSTDGRSWTPARHDEDTLGGTGEQRIDGVVSTTSGVLGVGVDGGALGDARVVLWRSADGLTWARGEPPAPARAVDEAPALAAAQGTVVAVAGAASFRAVAARPPPEPSPWTAVDVPGGGTVHGLAASAGGFVAVGESASSTAAAWWSDDGRRWRRAEVPGDGPTAMRAVTRAGPFLVAVGVAGVPGSPAADAAAWRSDDGRRWERVVAPQTFDAPGRQEASAVAAGPSGVVAAGVDTSTGTFDGAAWRTVDGRVWERVAVDAGGFGGLTDDLVRAVVWTGERWVAAGASGVRDGGLDLDAAFWTSPDGVVWDRVVADPALVGGAGDQAVAALAALDGGAVVAGGYDSPAEDEADAVLWRIEPATGVARDSSGVWGGPGRQAVNALARTRTGRTVAAGVTAGRGGQQDLRSWVDGTVDHEQRSVGSRDEPDFALAAAARGSVVVAGGSRLWWREAPPAPQEPSPSRDQTVGRRATTVTSGGSTTASSPGSTSVNDQR